ncbi:MAG: hypothetical protein R3E90_12915 [Marinicella sp.]
MRLCLIVLALFSDFVVAAMPEFLLGSWQINGKNEFEVWSKINNNHYQGQVIQIIGGRKQIKEILNLEATKDELVYLAKVMNQNDGKTIAFSGKLPNNNGFKISNLNHDFPQIITYQQLSTDHITTHVVDKSGEGFTQELMRKDLPTTIPAWFFTEIQTHAGRWEADNSKYQSENEPYDTYVIEWQLGIGGTSLTGRLFALTDGKVSQDFWHYRQYWDNLKQQAVLEQFGLGGVIGSGPLHYINEHHSELIQTFTRPDGSQWQGKHINQLDGNQFTTQSLQMDTNGEW